MSFDLQGVSLASAVLWAKGRIHDTQLDRSRPEVVFWNELGHLAGYRPALERIRSLALPAMIVHACNVVVWRKLEREGCVCTVEEEIVWRGNCVQARRYVATPAAFGRWLGKIAQKSAAASGVTTSR